MSSEQAQKIIKESGFIRLGDVAPDFKQASTKGEISFHDYIGDNWAILFSHPKAKTPICTTELAELNKRMGDFEALGVKVVAIAVDSVDDTQSWVGDIAKLSGEKDVKFPILCDEDYLVAKLYGMVNQEHIDAKGMPLTVRSVFFIAPDKKVGTILTLPANVGRNVDEIIRIVNALQLTTKFFAEGKPVACPVNWNKGSRIVVPPFVSTEKALELFEEVQIVEPYLRFANEPQ
jgi:alkyl hydroperoxide reductase subunit AhpC